MDFNNFAHSGAIGGPFRFRVSAPGANGLTWVPGPAPSFTTIGRGAGVNGSDRFLVTWRDGAIKNQWLEVTVLPSTFTGLTSPEVFYFGNLIGEAGAAAAAAGWRVSALDLAAVRRALNTDAAVTSPVDFNRDGRVNALDLAIVKQALNQSLPVPPPSSAAGPGFIFSAGTTANGDKDGPEPLRSLLA